MHLIPPHAVTFAPSVRNVTTAAPFARAPPLQPPHAGDVAASISRHVRCCFSLNVPPSLLPPYASLLSLLPPYALPPPPLPLRAATPAPSVRTASAAAPSAHRHPFSLRAPTAPLPPSSDLSIATSPFAHIIAAPTPSTCR